MIVPRTENYAVLVDAMRKSMKSMKAAYRTRDEEDQDMSSPLPQLQMVAGFLFMLVTQAERLSFLR